MLEAHPDQLMPSDKILERHGDWALVQDRDGDRYVSHIGKPKGWPAIPYDIDFSRLLENWERQIDEKSWATPESKAGLAVALRAARVMASAPTSTSTWDAAADGAMTPEERQELIAILHAEYARLDALPGDNTASQGVVTRIAHRLKLNL
jgi:hypothetical protein